MGIMTIVDAATTPLAGRLGDRWRAHAWVATVGLALLVPGLLVVGLTETVGGTGERARAHRDRDGGVRSRRSSC